MAKVPLRTGDVRRSFDDRNDRAHGDFRSRSMRVSRTTVYRLGLIWSVSCFALAANAAGGERPDDIRPPDLPELVLSHDVAGAPSQDLAQDLAQAPDPIAELRIEAPDLPAVVVSVPRIEPAPDTATLALPDLPDAPVAITFNDRIRTALTDQIAKDLDDRTLRVPRKDREALAAFYEANGHQPLWVKDGAWTQAATIVTERLKTADEDGLDPTDYPVPVLASTKGLTPADWAEAEIKLSTSAILYARDARGSRIDPARLSSLITPKLELPSAAEVLSRLAAARDP